eukprot:CAMPEP_0181178138 /NCGR_PEP_ID=MMETSP1096-20121128/5557_1 /TAXON_ID=156174 ORGANISM="Chrysochromulina ericina, Strain CCMP281" /NCGR_SAMPLE_ID=MMETSP1096 /ASSEMBLY_ACC=CAM_ASM_000453 /LENGTH=72 /DNA_ID=CAMNT_0023266381 /DNA_START=464 /DNA_END=682 /DNA_ORIENTATION=+
MRSRWPSHIQRISALPSPPAHVHADTAACSSASDTSKGNGISRPAPVSLHIQYKVDSASSHQLDSSTEGEMR